MVWIVGLGCELVMAASLGLRTAVDLQKVSKAKLLIVRASETHSSDFQSLQVYLLCS